MLYKPRQTSAFTLIEILIVVIILGILAAIVVPQFGSAAASANQSSLLAQLRYMREEIEAFKYQHTDTSPGYPAGNRGAAPDLSDFTAQMTTTTDVDFNAVTAAAGNALGPYISSVPANPVNGNASILFIANGATFPTSADGLYGWVYQPSTMTFRSDALGSDQTGATYFSY